MRVCRMFSSTAFVCYWQAPAPDDILNVVRCKCKQSSRNQCGSNLCSCHKNGLSCVSACGECNGIACYNAGDSHEHVEDDIEDGNLFERLF